MRFVLSPGQAADVTNAPPLIDGLQFDALLADKGYDADWLVDLVKSAYRAEAVIPPRKGRKKLRGYDPNTYKQRNLVERFIVSTMGLKPSPSGETFRFLYWRDGELPHGSAQPL